MNGNREYSSPQQERETDQVVKEIETDIESGTTELTQNLKKNWLLWLLGGLALLAVVRR